ncbi:TolC family protein [Limnohabitans sp. INBF002]|jgi:adhesin transport system outer membrane protein|uniref:TolC family protein n=1 Tax=Limnohabitans sp. INBF002 TaxID=2986280 RepID=UPI0023775933|nr:TolC family protein [Limnohabitans sp. INBF002]BDU51789.1 transporter [Limnohabitans sp. INBF002]
MKTRTQQIKWTCVGAALLILGGPVKAQSFTEVIQNALAIYPSMLSARAKTEAQRSDIDRARAAHMPQINYGYTRSKYANSDLPASLHSNMRSPSVRFNLWSGGRIEADAERAEALSYSSEYQEAITRDDVALLAAEAYINWARAIDMFELAAKNFESHRITLSDIQKIVDVDTGRRIDLEQAQVRMDNASLTKLQRQTELLQTRQRLGRFWQGPLPVKPIGLNEALVPTGRLGQVPQTLELVMDAVSDDLPTIAQQKAQVQAAEAGVTLARGQYWPTVDLTATRQLNPVSNGLFATSYKEDTFTQVQVNMPLYSGGATSAGIRTATSQLTAAQNGLDEARLLAREKAGVAYQDWVNAQGRATQGESQARVGDKVVEGYRLQFRLARRQLLDLLNIQAEAFSYQSAATTAIYDEKITRARLLAAMGDLARRF